ncbi:hypothetical protein HPB48_003624 [Haemaphysalis longicornis]|uniref:Uncharacterized protein n=1 Tax=Haemaphysalis longicornis TaxID=44386 RepID=A0A9J6FGR7_HAELO|nr:hypothetical protein HPB48_003624 [Haemaphysalis longicornis]
MGTPHISGYRTYAPPVDKGNKVNIATLISKALTAQEHQFYEEEGVMPLIVNILLLNKRQGTLRIANV